MHCANRVVTFLFVVITITGLKRREDKTKCPEVKAIKNFNLQQMLGPWFVVEYFASAEEVLSYSCMRAVFSEDETVNQAMVSRFGMYVDVVADNFSYFTIMLQLLLKAHTGYQYILGLFMLDCSLNGFAHSGTWTPSVTMNFTYSYTDDPDASSLLGNITWRVDPDQPAHWTHEEDTYEGIYNTYILDTEYKSWALLLHCAEKTGSARFLSAFVLSRTRHLPRNVLSYLRDKLPRYDVDPRYVFGVPHERCTPRARYPPAPLFVPFDDRPPQNKYHVN